MIALAVLALAAAGCSLSNGSAPQPAVPLAQARISADYLPFLSFGLKQPRHHYTLRCGTGPAGTYPHPARTCLALFAYLRASPGECGGTGYDGGPTTSIRGTADDHPVSIRIDASRSWCDQPLSVQRALWVLSAFPCSTYVRTWPVGAKGPVPSSTAIRDRCERANGIPTAHG